MINKLWQIVNIYDGNRFFEEKKKHFDPCFFLTLFFNRTFFFNTKQLCRYSIRVMQQGRMKGQAFVTFPTPQVAEEARALTNGYILNDKPMVVAFARAKATS